MLTKIYRKNYLNCIFLTLIAFFLADGLAYRAMATPVTDVWKVVHEPADDGSVTSLAYIENGLGDRFSLAINAIQRKKVCAIRQGSLPYSYATEYKGKLLIDKESIWEGKIVSVNPAVGDILILRLGFDWSELLQKLKKGHNLAIHYTDGIISEEMEFSLKGSTKAINVLLDKQYELAREEQSKESQQKP